jgi:hypothetical protein
MEPVAAIAVLSKLIGAGLAAKGALLSEGFDDKDITALKTFLDTGADLAKAGKAPSSGASASHLALVARAFGQAFGRHWQHDTRFVPKGGLGRFLSKDERRRAEEIEARTRAAALKLKTPGDRPPDKAELNLVESLGGSPLDTPYFRALWDAYAEPGSLLLGAEGGDPPLLMSDTTRREFERHFLLAYWEALSSPAGEVVSAYLEKLSSYRALLVRDLLLEDMASWGGRHVFGNLERKHRERIEPLPFMPLEEMYVEPDGVLERGGKTEGKAEPILGLVDRLLGEPRVHVVVVKADFGSGKSLTARTLAARWAERYLKEARAVSMDLPLPVFVRCTDDFPGGGFDLGPVVRRAFRRQAVSFDLSLPAGDEAFAMPEARQKMIFLLDGLDEVAFGARQLDALFERLLGEDATDRQRFVIFSRPGALPSSLDKQGVRVVRLLPFQRASGDTQLAGAIDTTPRDQIAKWLERWNPLSRRSDPITLAKLDARGLLEIASTPILLLMIAHTWDFHSERDTPAELAEIYEDFFWHIARGKHEADQDENKAVFEASERLLKVLRTRGELGDGAEAPDAMLWLMGRVAWEARKLEQLEPPVQLRTRHVDNLVEKELGIDGAEDVIRIIRVGLLLAMQADLETRSDHILFGHRSFREFLVARYWASRLRKIVEARPRDRDMLTGKLLGGGLLGEKEKSFRFLMQMVNSTPSRRRAASPLGWTVEERRALIEWCQDQFESEEQDFGDSRCTALRADQRAMLREAALAIGSSTAGSKGLTAKPGALRSMLTWFWSIGQKAIVIAPKANLQHADLHDADIREADLHEADLTEARLEKAHLSRANLERALLRNAFGTRATFDGAILVRADMRGIWAFGSRFIGAQLEGALLDGGALQYAIFMGANLAHASLDGVELTDADMQDADLRGANLSNADLEGAVLTGAILTGAVLTGATYNSATQWPAGFDPALHGAIRREDAPDDRPA